MLYPLGGHLLPAQVQIHANHATGSSVEERKPPSSSRHSGGSGSLQKRHRSATSWRDRSPDEGVRRVCRHFAGFSGWSMSCCGAQGCPPGHGLRVACHRLRS